LVVGQNDQLWLESQSSVENNGAKKRTSSLFVAEILIQTKIILQKIGPKLAGPAWAKS
jgi:hypothetical protein